MRKKKLFYFGALFLILLVFPSAFGQQTAPKNDDDEVLRIDTELINVPAVVTDKNGKPIGKLTAKNFAIFEDGKLQQIENFASTDAPFEVALLLDTSGSTRSELNLIQRAANAFIKNLRSGDKVAIVAFKTENFAGRKREAAVDILTDLTNDRVRLENALTAVQTSGGTPFYEALETITEKIFPRPAAKEMRGRRAIVALTDGVDSTSQIEFEDAQSKIKDAELTCYFVELNTESEVEDRILGDCDDPMAMRFSKTQLRRYGKMLRARTGQAKPELNDFCEMGQFERMDISRKLYKLARFQMRELARSTGGKTFPVAELGEARAAFAEVAAEIGTQYSLGYYSNNDKKDGVFRRIRVELRGLPAGTNVKTREGYYAEKK
jgi:Ca-activated chloride channel family protein